MLCIPVKGPAYDQARNQIGKARSLADVVELRLDLFEKVDIEAVKALKHDFPFPMIFTLRKKDQGGGFTGTENERLQFLEQLAALKPHYLDLECDTPIEFVKGIIKNHPEVRIIVSFHDFQKTPEDLDALWQNLQKVPGDIYKIATFAPNTNEALRMMRFLRGINQNKIGISMGDNGQITRILAPTFDSFLTFTSLNEDNTTAPGQITIHSLLDTYRYRSLNGTTKIYGLIGDPVEQSIGHYVHNAVMEEFQLNAVYVKMNVAKDELASFFSIARQLDFGGLSVTMPLKDAVLPFLDSVDPKAKDIGAVNTIGVKDGEWIGYNTDAAGAMEAIEKKASVSKKRVILIGAGGAAKAIAYEAIMRGADLIILNRNKAKAVEFAKEFECEGGGLDQIEKEFKKGYDVIINSTPAAMPIDPNYIVSGCVAMDVKTRPQLTDFLSAAQAKNCRLVYGYEMFINQAAGQTYLWYGDQVELDLAREIIEEKTLEFL